ncbi:MAG TPA: sigma-70 family RNA polymerase sigma factor [Lacipirellula sp.]
MDGLESKREFVVLLAKHERMIYGYVLSLVPNLADADEIVQETCLRLWDEFDKYVPGSSFAAWALTVAHYEVLTWRKKVQRSKLVFDDALVELIGKERGTVERAAGPRQEALADCLQELTEGNRQLVAECYGAGRKIKEVAAKLQKTEASVYKALERIRSALHRCIERKLSGGGPR